MSNTTFSVNANPSVVVAAASEGDSRIHSLPHNKHGPYTCPKCNKVFSKSQSFAAHASSYYKNETREQKIRRLISRTKNKTISAERLNNEITLAPVSFQSEAAALENTNIRHTLGPPPGFEGQPRYGDAKTDHGQKITQNILDYIKNLLGHPPGFEGHPHYGDAKTDQSTLHHINDNLSHPPGFEDHPHYGDVKNKSEADI